MAKRKEVINGLHNVFTLNSADLYDISTFSYEQSVDENTILFAIADSEDVGKYITINGEPKIISENDNFIITNGVVFSGNGGGSGSTCNCGYRTVQTAAELNTIGSCEIGTVVYVIDEDKFYIYNGTDFSVIDLGGNHMLPADVYATLNVSNNIPKITSTVGFDDIKNPGIYFLGAGYNQFPGILYVVTTTSEKSYVVQVYINFMFPNHKFTRTYNNSSWGEWSCITNETGASSEYTAGTNIDITDNVISATGYTYDDNKFYIGNTQTYETINDLSWEILYEGEERPEQLSISYNGADSSFDFNSIIRIGDFIRFFDIDNEGETICKVISVNTHNFSVDKFWPIAAAYTTVSKVVGGASLLAKNDGSIYIKNIGDYSGNLNYIPNSVSTLQDVINMNSEAINDLYEQGSTGQEYTGSDNIHISEEGVITALGYNYVSGVTQLSKAQINNDGTFNFNPASKLTSSYSNFDIKDTNVKIYNTNSNTAKVTLQYVDVESNSNITTTGSISAAQGFFETSDIRKKNVIDELPLDKAYELINNCQSIIYTLKDNTDKQQIGLIAQEVQQYFPEVVSEDKDGYLSLDYAKLTSVIFRVLKDVIDRLNKLENK